jgi:tetratricopeptide (TPR) repeat protein
MLWFSKFPTMDQIEPLIIHLIDHYLLTFQYENAKFYSERLYYQQPISEHLFLLAKCYYLQGKHQQVYHLLKQEQDFIPNRYLFSLICFHLKKYSECEYSLLPSDDRQQQQQFDPLTMTKEDIARIPGGSGGLFLLGKVCQKEQRKHHAVKYFQTCLEVRLSSFELSLYLSLS